MLFVFYKQYQSKRKNDVSKIKSKKIGSANTVHENLISGWSLEDIEDTMRELGRNDFLSNSYFDNTITDSYLTDYALSVMENQKKEIFLNITDFIAKFIP